MEKLQLEYFLLAAEMLNISKAAEILCISQPSLSQTIKKLEIEIGYPLFNRKGKHISLNGNGQIFLNCVKRMKSTYENALEEIAEKNNVKNKEISINMCCASYFLPQLMLYLEENLRDAAFRITQRNYAPFQNDETDLKIIATSEPLDTDYGSLLLEENILLAVPQNHNLFKRENISISDLLSENFISLSPVWSLEQMIRTECQKKKFHPKILIEVDNPDILRRLLAEKIGLAFVPEKTWGKAFANDKFDLRTVSDFLIKRYVYIVWNEGFVLENVKQCIHYVRNFFAEYE